MRGAGAGELVRRLVRASPGWVAAAGLLTAIRLGIFSARLWWISRRLHPECRFRPYPGIVAGSQLLVLGLPGMRPAASLLRAQLARRRFGGRLATHLAANLADQGSQAVAWAACAVALGPALVLRGPRAAGPALLSGLAASLAALAVGWGWLRHRREDLARWSHSPAPGGGRLRRAAGLTLRGAAGLAADRSALGVGLAGGAGFVLAGGLAQAAALRAVGLSAPWWVAVAAVVLGTSAGAASNAPGGAGVAEATQAAVFAALGLPAGPALAGVFLARGLHYASVAILGSAALLHEARRGGEAAPAFLPPPTPADPQDGDRQRPAQESRPAGRRRA
ncbi:MAG: UPF0104 family protein [Acidobacteria bacterium]|nr:MAG: UPF0104 family protein [Acidobacteriota bacterium]